MNIKKEINEEAIAEYYQLQYSIEQKTPFTDIKKVKPGTYLKLNLGSNELMKKEYFQLEYSSDKQNKINVIKELDELLSRQLSRDSDLWIVEIESRQGDAYLDDI